MAADGARPRGPGRARWPTGGAASRAPADVAVDGGTHHRRGPGSRAGRGGDRRRRAAGHPGLRRHPHPLRRAGDLGRADDAVELARRDHGGHGQLRRRLRTGATRCAPAAHFAHGRGRGHSRRGARRGDRLVVGELRRVPRPRSSGVRTTSTCARSSRTARSASTSWASGRRGSKRRHPRTPRPCAAWPPRPCGDGAIGFSTSRTLNHRTAERGPDAVAARRDGRARGHRPRRGRRRARRRGVDLRLLARHRRRVRAGARHGGAHRRAPLPLTGPEPSPSRGMARPSGADRGRGRRGPAHPGPGGAPPRRAARRAAVLLPPAAGLPRPTRDTAGTARRRAGPCAARPGPAGPGSWPTWRRTRRRRTAGGQRAPATPDRLRRASTRWATCPTTSPRPRRACCGWPRRGVSNPPRCSWTCCPRTTAATSSTPRSPTTPTGTSTPAAKCSPTPSPLLGLGDGGAHVGLISDASFPTYALSPLGP